MNEKEIRQWDDHMAKQREKLEIDTFRNKDTKGTIRIESDSGKCNICGIETPYILFLNKYGQGTGLCVCKDCLKETVKMLEK